MRLHVSGQSRPTSLREWPADQGQRHLHSVTWDTALSCHVELLTGDLLRLLWTYNARKRLLRPCKACLTSQGGRCAFSAGGGEKRGPSTRWKCCAHTRPTGMAAPRAGNSRVHTPQHSSRGHRLLLSPGLIALTGAHHRHAGWTPACAAASFRMTRQVGSAWNRWDAEARRTWARPCCERLLGYHQRPPWGWSPRLLSSSWEDGRCPAPLRRLQ